MSRRLLLWDIDGTLLRAGEVAAAVFDQAVSDVVGRPAVRRPRMGGKTDPDILQAYFEDLGVPEDPDTSAAVLAALEKYLRARSAELPLTGTVCPGVPELLARLASDHRLINGVLTGNIAPTARIKLAAFGLDRWLDPVVGAYGSDHADRNALVPIALCRAVEARGLRFGPDDVWVIGDTPFDLACARAATAHCLLVATGSFSFAELGALGADATLRDLANVDAVVELLTAGL